MSDMTIPDRGAVRPETSPPAPAEQAVQTPATSEATQEASGTEQHPHAPDEGQTEQKEPSQGELARKERNRQRWQAMKEEAANARRRESILLSEIERLRRGVNPDLSQVVDPDEIIAEKAVSKLRSAQLEDTTARVQTERNAAHSALAQAWQATVEEMSARTPDFVETISKVPIHDRAAPFIIESDRGGELAYYLGKNPNVARDLYAKFESEPAKALIEIGRLEAKLAEPSPKKTSTAPRPASVLSGGQNPLQFDPSSASVDDVAAQLRKAGVIV